mgnify:CR=1 FL=1
MSIEEKESLLGSDKKFIIFSPHSDDFVIGCWNLIKNGKVKMVVYCGFDEDAEAEEGMRRFCKDFGIELKEVEYETMIDFVYGGNVDLGNDVLLFPSQNDHHPAHKLIGSLFNLFAFDGMKCGLYSIDMNVEWIRVVDDWREKYDILNKYFPTKKDLWESDKKYVLFEGVVVNV